MEPTTHTNINPPSSLWLWIIPFDNQKAKKKLKFLNKTNKYYVYVDVYAKRYENNNELYFSLS